LLKVPKVWLIKPKRGGKKAKNMIKDLGTGGNSQARREKAQRKEEASRKRKDSFDTDWDWRCRRKRYVWATGGQVTCVKKVEHEWREGLFGGNWSGKRGFKSVPTCSGTSRRLRQHLAGVFLAGGSGKLPLSLFNRGNPGKAIHKISTSSVIESGK